MAGEKPKTEQTANGLATYLAPDFRVYYPEKPTIHNGKPYAILPCEELIGARWDDFVSMRLVKDMPRRTE
jgi:hypothetical protein